jgi:hypothetical protein
MDANQKPLPLIEDHVGEKLQCEDAWHEDVRQLREVVCRQREVLIVMQSALNELLSHPLPWIK